MDQNEFSKARCHTTSRLSRPGHTTRLTQNRNHAIPQTPRPESRSYRLTVRRLCLLGLGVFGPMLASATDGPILIYEGILVPPQAPASGAASATLEPLPPVPPKAKDQSPWSPSSPTSSPKVQTDLPPPPDYSTYEEAKVQEQEAMDIYNQGPIQNSLIQTVRIQRKKRTGCRMTTGHNWSLKLDDGLNDVPDLVELSGDKQIVRPCSGDYMIKRCMSSNIQRVRFVLDKSVTSSNKYRYKITIVKGGEDYTYYIKKKAPGGIENEDESTLTIGIDELKTMDELRVLCDYKNGGAHMDHLGHTFKIETVDAWIKRRKAAQAKAKEELLADPYRSSLSKMCGRRLAETPKPDSIRRRPLGWKPSQDMDWSPPYRQRRK